MRTAEQQDAIEPAPPYRDVAAEFDEGETDPDMARAKGGINFHVQEAPLYYSGQDGQAIRVPGEKALIRLHDDVFIARRAETYPVLQNEVAFRVPDAMVKNKKAKYVAAGMLANGAKVFMLAELPGIIKVGGQDQVRKLVLAATAHDGSIKAHLNIAPLHVRTASFLPAGHELDLGVRHTSNMMAKLADAERLIGQVSKEFDEFEETADKLARTKMTRSSMMHLAQTLFPSRKAEGDDLSLRISAFRSKLVELFEESPLSGTAWAALVAVSQFTDHHRTTRVAGGDREERKVREARLDSIWFGKSATMKAETLDWLTR